MTQNIENSPRNYPETLDNKIFLGKTLMYQILSNININIFEFGNIWKSEWFNDGRVCLQWMRHKVLAKSGVLRGSTREPNLLIVFVNDFPVAAIIMD